MCVLRLVATNKEDARERAQRNTFSKSCCLGIIRATTTVAQEKGFIWRSLPVPGQGQWVKFKFDHNKSELMLRCTIYSHSKECFWGNYKERYVVCVHACMVGKLWSPWATHAPKGTSWRLVVATHSQWPPKQPFCAILFCASPRVTNACETRLSWPCATVQVIGR